VNTIARVIVQRRTDELILVCPSSSRDEYNETLEYYLNLGINTKLVDVDNFNFEKILSVFLSVVDDTRLDIFDIEFNIHCKNPAAILAACIASIMTESLLITSNDTNFSNLLSLKPSRLLNMSKNKRIVLEYLDMQYGPVPQMNISRDTSLNRSSVSRHLKDLKQAGYVKRNRIGKEKIAEITPLGQLVVHHKLMRKRKVWDNSTHSQIYLALVAD
jgi:DNA-binding transcriptional ArsR family regulator